MNDTQGRTVLGDPGVFHRNEITGKAVLNTLCQLTGKMLKLIFNNFRGNLSGQNICCFTYHLSYSFYFTHNKCP